jgi:hypothetical protein
MWLNGSRFEGEPGGREMRDCLGSMIESKSLPVVVLVRCPALLTSCWKVFWGNVFAMWSETRFQGQQQAFTREYNHVGTETAQ